MTAVRPPERLIGLPEVASRLGLHRATVNAMVQDGRLPAERIGPHWFIKQSVADRFADNYVRPKNAPRHRTTPQAGTEWQARLLRLLSDWHDATVAELATAIELHPGNIRKYLCLLEAEGWVRRDEYGSWVLTEAGQAHGSVVAPLVGRSQPCNVAS